MESFSPDGPAVLSAGRGGWFGCRFDGRKSPRRAVEKFFRLLDFPACFSTGFYDTIAFRSAGKGFRRRRRVLGDNGSGAASAARARAAKCFRARAGSVCCDTTDRGEASGGERRTLAAAETGNRFPRRRVFFAGPGRRLARDSTAVRRKPGRQLRERSPQNPRPSDGSKRAQRGKTKCNNRESASGFKHMTAVC